MSNSNVIQIINNSCLSISHISNISTSYLLLFNAFLVFKLLLNLLSVRQLQDLSLDIHFSYDGCSVQDIQMGQIFKIGYKVSCLFELTSLQSPSQITYTVPKCVVLCLLLHGILVLFMFFSFDHNLYVLMAFYEMLKIIILIMIPMNLVNIMLYHLIIVILLLLLIFYLVHFDIWKPSPIVTTYFVFFFAYDFS